MHRKVTAFFDICKIIVIFDKFCTKKSAEALLSITFFKRLFAQIITFFQRETLVNRALAAKKSAAEIQKILHICKKKPCFAKKNTFFLFKVQSLAFRESKTGDLFKRMGLLVFVQEGVEFLGAETDSSGTTIIKESSADAKKESP